PALPRGRARRTCARGRERPATPRHRPGGIALAVAPGACHLMCPSADLLVGFTSGELSPDQHAALESHIDVCPECRAVLSSLVQGSVPEPHIARYRIETVLGGGGMGLIYRAFDPQLARAVAIKVLKHARDDESLRIQLVREAQSLARLSHPNVC